MLVLWQMLSYPRISDLSVLNNFQLQLYMVMAKCIEKLSEFQNDYYYIRLHLLQNFSFRKCSLDFKDAHERRVLFYNTFIETTYSAHK